MGARNGVEGLGRCWDELGYDTNALVSYPQVHMVVGTIPSDSPDLSRGPHVHWKENRRMVRKPKNCLNNSDWSTGLGRDSRD